MSAVIKMMRTPSSDDDLRKILGNNIKIVLYPELSKHNNIRELINIPKDCCIILYEEKHLCGHWTCLTRIMIISFSLIHMDCALIQN